LKLPVKTNEATFESEIESHLLKEAGYESIAPSTFDKERAIFPDVLIDFIQKTQPENWETLVKLQGDNARETLLTDLCKTLDSQGCLNVLRHGFKCFGKTFRIAYFAPSHSMNPETERLFDANRLGVTRQLVYSPNHGNSLDLVLSVNGIPIVTAELKNALSGQNVNHAKHQYRHDRDPKDLIFQFKKRTLVHFAVDTEEAWMATKLAGKSTYFLPFNQGNRGGAGNAENPVGRKTDSLWEEVWQRDSLMDLLGRFLHLQKIEKEVDGKRRDYEVLIFPRYHQMDSVRKLENVSRMEGPGHNYLIQHSAGSGKSNSIAWLAHRLASLHDKQDEKVFDSVIVITDRVVLDKQLQDTIYQFEHKQGVVQKIDQDSTQLANAVRSGVPIIITTLQKFPFVTDKIGDLPERKYAVIVDEAHSSQSGEGAAELKGVLAGAAIKKEAKKQAEEEGLTDYEEEILKTIAKRGRQPNISFYAFTATPKYKTLEVFGHPGADGKPVPFHLYSMRQAIEEEFILDVLQHYTTYKAYYGLIKAIEDDPEVDKKKAARALARFMSLHPHNIAQKTEVMVEHFHHFTRHKIGGRAKAMVVTGSRLHAVRYKEAFDKYLKDHGYSHLKTLVAFSGTVVDDLEKEYTEVGMNKGIREKELPRVFASDEYQVLIVAEKYQTGFDQPLLHTMYVDKRLAGVQAVQTLSRLNRTHPGKEDTFVLDFVNEPDGIYEAFKPYYEAPSVGDRANPQELNDMKSELDARQVYYHAEVENLCKVFFKAKADQTEKDHAAINSILDPAVDRFNALEEKDREDFRKKLVAFRNLYSFLSQIIPYQDSDLEKLYTYVRFLLRKLPKRDLGPNYQFDDEVSLKYYRLQKISEGTIDLGTGESPTLKGPSEVGTGGIHDEMVTLSSLVDQINERFGTEFTISDQLFFEQIAEDAIADPHIQQSALANSKENFKFVFDKALQDFFLDRMDQNSDLFGKFMDDPDFRGIVSRYLLDEVYGRIQSQSQWPSMGP